MFQQAAIGESEPDDRNEQQQMRVVGLVLGTWMT